MFASPTDPEFIKVTLDSTRYNSNGTLMFIATDDSRVEIFERHPDGTHTALDEPLFVHSDDVEDCDIAPDDSCTPHTRKPLVSLAYN